MTDTTPEAIERMADYYNRWAHDIREMNGASVDADHADMTAATLRALLAENERLRADLANAVTVKVKPLECYQCQSPATKLLQMTTHKCDPTPICEDCADEHDVISSAINEHEMREFGGVYGQVTYHYLPIPASDDNLPDLLKAEREKALRGLLADKEARNSAFDAMWKVATETYSLEATNDSGARYSITGDVVNALWYAAILALIDRPTQEQD